MFCPYCRNAMPKGAMFCTECGADLREELIEETAPEEAQPAPQPAPVEASEPEVESERAPEPVVESAAAPEPDAPATPAPEPKPAAPVQETGQARVSVSRDTLLLRAADKNLGMKWYKFLIFFWLFFSCFAYLRNAITYISLANLYSDYGTAVAALGFESICLVAFGAVAIYVRYLMAHFKKTAVKTWEIYLIVRIVYSIIQIILTYGLMASVSSSFEYSDSGELAFSLLTDIGYPVVYLLCNRAYFNKRAFLFVND